MGYATLSLVWTPDFSEGVQELGQFAMVAVAYLVGWRAYRADPRLTSRLRTYAPWLMLAALIVFFNATADGISAIGWIRGGNVARPMVMMLALLFLLGTLNRTRRFTIWLWIGAVAIALATGGRMGLAVLGALLLFVPSTGFSNRMRLGLVVAGLAALTLVIQLEPVQERLFLGRQQGDIEDILTLERNFNTAGRSNNWPRIVEACAPGATFGNGAGAARDLTLVATAGRTAHPHNDYIRISCEYGVAGSILFWGFFVAAGFRGYRLFRHRAADELESEVGAVGALTVVALLMFASTDNVVVYTSTYMAAAGLVLGLSDGTLDRVRRRQASNELGNSRFMETV